LLLINGEPATTIDATDRGLQYGDGLFETCAIWNGRPQQWQQHFHRLTLGCKRLGIPLPDGTLLYQEAMQLCHAVSRGVLKIVVTRGGGGRGYRPPAQPAPNRLLQSLPWPDYPASYRQRGIRARLCATPVGQSPALAGLKSLNRLEQVLARAEWSDPEIAEGLMLDPAGHPVEGTMSNLFVVIDGCLRTPDLSRGGVAGIMRQLIIEMAATLAIECRVDTLTLEDLWSADGLFFCNSLIGLWPVRELAGQAMDPEAIPRRLIESLTNQLEYL